MIDVLRETTGQVGDFFYQPHIYYVDSKKGKLIAYKRFTGLDELAMEYGDIEFFTRPLSFDKRRREFEKLGQVKEIK